MSAHVLIVEDEEPLRISMAIALKRGGYDVAEAGTVRAAVALLEQEAFDLVVSDLRLPDGDGLEVLRHAGELVPDARVLIMTAYGTVKTAVEAMQGGAFDFVQKPFAPEQLMHRVERALEHGRMSSELRRLSRATDPTVDIVGRSAPMQLVRQRIEQAAGSRTVLICGETGTGKELVARAIHTTDDSTGTFVVVNCAGISESVMDSELFGHVRGAFTGAITSRRGLLEEADGGTLFLDEVGEIPPTMQAKLLRFLQFGEVRPIGSNRTTKVKVRVLAATNRNLKEEAAKGNFREDLVYRLDVMRVNLPPLRERLDDLPELCSRLLARVAAQLHKRPPTISEAAVAHLSQGRWRGNVRELENVLERAILTAGQSDLEPEHFVLDHAGHATAPQAQALADVERSHIVGVIERAHGDRAAACEILGISRSTLRRKLIEYGMWTEG